MSKIIRNRYFAGPLLGFSKPVAYAVTLFLLGGEGAANTTETLLLLEGSTMHLSGTSNLHDWECYAPVTRGLVLMDTSFSKVQAFLHEIQDHPESISDADLEELFVQAKSSVKEGQLSVPLEEFVFRNNRMKRDMYNTFQAEEHPLIEFSFERLASLSVANVENEFDLILHTEGLLKMAGVRRPILLDLHVVLDEQGQLRVAAVKHTKMTDFGMAPPVALLGLLKAHDPVVVRFDLRIGPPRGSPEAATR